MDKNEREALENRVAPLEKTIEACTHTVDEAEKTAKAARAKKARCKVELAAIKKQLAGS